MEPIGESGLFESIAQGGDITRMMVADHDIFEMEGVCGFWIFGMERERKLWGVGVERGCGILGGMGFGVKHEERLNLFDDPTGFFIRGLKDLQRDLLLKVGGKGFCGGAVRIRLC